MEKEERKRFLENALINSFVDEYEAYKKTINFINTDLNKFNFQYSYDEFCVSFLKETLKNVEDVDIFNYNDFSQFYLNFWKFNLYNLQSMLTSKLKELGYKYEDFYKDSIMKQRIEENYENNTDF